MRLACFYGATHKTAYRRKRRCFRLGSDIRPRVSGQVRALARWAFYCSPVRQSRRIQGVAVDHVRFSSREFPSSRDQYVRALDVRL